MFSEKIPGPICDRVLAEEVLCAKTERQGLWFKVTTRRIFLTAVNPARLADERGPAPRALTGLGWPGRSQTGGPGLSVGRRKNGAFSTAPGGFELACAGERGRYALLASGSD